MVVVGTASMDVASFNFLRGDAVLVVDLRFDGFGDCVAVVVAIGVGVGNGMEGVEVAGVLACAAAAAASARLFS